MPRANWRAIRGSIASEGSFGAQPFRTQPALTSPKLPDSKTIFGTQMASAGAIHLITSDWGNSALNDRLGPKTVIEQIHAYRSYFPREEKAQLRASPPNTR